MSIKGPVNLGKSVVVNVDVQNAFGEEAESDKLRELAPGERDQVKKASELSEAVHDAGGVVISTKDWHNEPGTKLPDGTIDNRAQEEFGTYGKHAVAGTRDAALNDRLESTMQRLEAKSGVERTVIGVDQYDTTAQAGNDRVIEAHKNTYDITKRMDVDGTMKPNMGFIQMLAQAQEQGVDTVLVTGKIAEVCVRAAAESIHDLFPEMRVVVVEDTISSLPDDAASAIGLSPKTEVMAELENKGIETGTIDQLLPSGRFIAEGALGL